MSTTIPVSLDTELPIISTGTIVCNFLGDCFCGQVVSSEKNENHIHITVQNWLLFANGKWHKTGGKIIVCDLKAKRSADRVMTARSAQIGGLFFTVYPEGHENAPKF